MFTPIKAENQDEVEREIQRLVQTTLQLKKNGLPRLCSAKWTEEDSVRFIRSLKTLGKNWKQIAIEVGTKNEQQCRTRGLILFNKL
jgi:hypothetical protein